MWYIYSLAFDSAMDLDTGLNYGMKYIAIDTNFLKGMTPKDKRRIINYFENKYKVDVFESNYDELNKKGLVNEDKSIDGILLLIEDTKIIFSNNYLKVQNLNQD